MKTYRVRFTRDVVRQVEIKQEAFAYIEALDENTAMKLAHEIAGDQDQRDRCFAGWKEASRKQLDKAPIRETLEVHPRSHEDDLLSTPTTALPDRGPKNNRPTPGVFLAEPCDLAGLSPGWAQKDDEVDLFRDDLEAWNAARKHEGKAPTTGYPFSLVAADWNGPQEQRFLVSLPLSITLRTETEDEIASTKDLATALAGNFLFQLKAIVDGDWSNHEAIMSWIEMIDCEHSSPEAT